MKDERKEYVGWNPDGTPNAPEMWGDKRAVYYCNYCQKPPKVKEGEELVQLSHDVCVWKNLCRGIVELSYATRLGA